MRHGWQNIKTNLQVDRLWPAFFSTRWRFQRQTPVNTVMHLRVRRKAPNLKTSCANIRISRRIALWSYTGSRICYECVGVVYMEPLCSTLCIVISHFQEKKKKFTYTWYFKCTHYHNHSVLNEYEKLLIQMLDLKLKWVNFTCSNCRRLMKKSNRHPWRIVLHNNLHTIRHMTAVSLAFRHLGATQFEHIIESHLQFHTWHS